MRLLPVSLLTLLLAGGLWLSQRRAGASPAPPVPMPSIRPLPDGEAGALVRQGADLVAHMPERLGGRIRSRLTCTNCHLNGGTKAEAAPWVGVSKWFPVYRARSGKMDTLADRVNDCIQRSLNGDALALDSREMRAILAYMDWLSQDVPPGRDIIGRGFIPLPSRSPDPVRGQQVFAQHCAACHGNDGAGKGQFPPLWGPHSFNVGAGMGRWRTAAAFVRANMPLGKGHSLSEADAVDVAGFITQQARPDFAAKDRDWPQGGKPVDTPY
jgi:thiosulfate dehydrogenase